MRSTTFFTLATAAILLLGACADDSVTSPSTGAGAELAKGGSGKGKGGKAANRIVYTHRVPEGMTEIYSMNPDGSGVVRLTTGPGTSSWSPRWTPDHRKIVFVSNRNGSEEIFIMEADGSNATQLTFTACCDRNPVVSPDGTRIAFQRLGAGIFLMNLDGSNPTQVTFDLGDVHPAWYPDGSRIIFANIADPIHAFWKVNADGSNRTWAYSCGA
jgi:TolB protein